MNDVPVEPISKPSYAGAGRGKQAHIDRIRNWANETAAAGKQIIVVNGQKAVVEEIGPIQFAIDRDLWERQPSESDRDWEMFCVYRDMVPWERTKKDVARSMNLAHDNGTVATINTTANMFRWDERVQAFDVAVDKRMREELYQRRLHARIKTAKIGRRMRMKAAEALTMLEAVVYVNVKDPITGSTKRVKKSALTASEITRLAEIGVKLERLALGEEDERIPPGATFNFTQINATQKVDLGDEELLDCAREIIRSREGSIIDVGADGRTNVDGA